MTSDLEVDTDAAAGAASAVARTAGEIAAGAAPPEPPSGPRWQSSAALDDLAATTRQELLSLADEVDAFRREIQAAFDDYDTADERAADRLKRAQ